MVVHGVVLLPGRGASTRQTWLSTTLALFLLAAATAQADPPKPLDPAFDEIVREEVQVGGPFVLGTMWGDSLEPSPRREVHIRIPATRASRLCLRVRSIDGLYEASRRYDIEATEPGSYTLRFDAKRRDLISGYGPGELILDGRLGDDCADPRGLTPLPSSWTSSISAEWVLLFVNSDRNDAKVTVPRRAGNEPSAAFDCPVIPVRKRQRLFDRVCSVGPLSELDPGGAALRFYRLGRPMGKPHPLALALPLRR